MYTANDHTFVILAYAENPYLEECVFSVINQNVRGHMIISTSTPNEYVKGLAQKYDLPLAVNSGVGDAVDNFNFGYSLAKTPLVTLCHQDDVYLPSFLGETLRAINKSKRPIIAFTDCDEYKNGMVIKSNRNLRIKRIINFPLRFPALQKKKWIRRMTLSVGCAILCSTVTYCKENIRGLPFSYDVHHNDWDAWERLSKQEGDFIYCPKPLIGHRVWTGSDTSKDIANGERTKADLEMFKRFWPDSIAAFINKFYMRAQDSNESEI